MPVCVCVFACVAIIGYLPEIIYFKATCSVWAIEMTQWVEVLAPRPEPHTVEENLLLQVVL